tara:strand:+ start:13824 stop:14828 length:1005 start_codon:yes stop_codon:yes gene_type:complete
MILLFIYSVLILLINIFLIKNNTISNKLLSEHQSFANHFVLPTGGIFILLPMIYLLYPNNLFLILTFSFLFLLGILSDLNILSSAKKRFLLQFILISIFVILNKLQVLPTRIEIIDNVIEDTIFSYLFTVFCLLILVNGSNFIDGLNGLLLGYLSFIIVTLYQVELIQTLDFSVEKFNIFILFIFFILLLNILNQLFLGDNGAYPLGFFVGFILIEIYNLNEKISPYFIILLLWYPCFEILFSIIRKIILKKNPLEPDTGHFHQNLLLFIKNKFNLNILKSNIISSLLILLYNLLIFYLASMAINHTSYQIILILISVLIYCVFYFLLKRNIKS